MAFLKLIFLFLLLMMQRCGILPKKLHNEPLSKVVKKPTDQNLNGSWRLTNDDLREITIKKNADPQESASVTAEKSEDILLSFFPDHTFTEVKTGGAYTAGKWNYAADSSLSMIYGNETKTFSLLFGREDSGLRLLTLKSASGQNLSLAGFGKSMEKFQDDPFYPANNSWRDKPSQSETNQQILNRLTGYLLHSAYLLKAADTRKQSIISWEFSKGVIKIYNGGIGLVPRENIPEIWTNYFYSKEDALKAYEMFDDYLRTTSYKGTPKGNWVLDDHAILMDIILGLKRRG